MRPAITVCSLPLRAPSFTARRSTVLPPLIRNTAPVSPLPSTAAADVAAAVQVALAASTIPEISEITWTIDTATITGTGQDDGTPFVCTFATADNGGAADSQTIEGGTSSTGTAATVGTGPNYADNTANWLGGALPVDGDDIVIRRPISILYSLDGLDDVTPATLRVYSEFWASNATIGLPEIHGSGANAYVEYRDRFLKFLGATLAEIGIGESKTRLIGLLHVS